MITTDGLFGPQFNVFRSDRRRGRVGSGCVLLSNCFPVIAIHSNSLSNLITNAVVFDDRVYRPDISCIELVSFFLVIAVYRLSTNSTAPAALPHTDATYSLFSHKLPTVIVVDFNCLDIDWTNLQPPSENIHNHLLEFFISNGFTQLNQRVLIILLTLFSLMTILYSLIST